MCFRGEVLLLKSSMVEMNVLLVWQGKIDLLTRRRNGSQHIDRGCDQNN